MAVNKVIFGNVTLIDTSEVTVTPDKMFEGMTALGANGEMQTGTFTIADELSEQDALLTELETVLAGKAAGDGGGQPHEVCTSFTINADSATRIVAIYYSTSGAMAKHVPEQGAYPITLRDVDCAMPIILIDVWGVSGAALISGYENLEIIYNDVNDLGIICKCTSTDAASLTLSEEKLGEWP